MIDKKKIIENILKNKKSDIKEYGKAFAPTNIALCKYWGKRDEELNIPVTDSLSISLANLGTTTTISFAESEDSILLNNNLVDNDSIFYRRIVNYLDLFRPSIDTKFKVETSSNIPIACGLASSASGFAALAKATNNLFGWKLSEQELSILSRMGSGSAARSLWNGFVQWYSGSKADGMDSYAEPLAYSWPELRIGILLVDDRQKSISSRDAMRDCMQTSPFYSKWESTVHDCLESLHISLQNKDFWSFGQAIENNSMAMHALMMSSYPVIMYSQPETISHMRKVWQLRSEGIAVFFTQDAGPNLKLVFLEKDLSRIKQAFAMKEIIAPCEEQVVLVDQKDEQVGLCEKIQAHEQGLLHRAFSVFLLRKQGEVFQVLMQQRATSKYHAGGLWTNTCCSHPRHAETVIQAAQRRMHEELNFSESIQEIGSFSYKANFDNGLIEHEYDHVLIGVSLRENFNPNPEEVEQCKWINLEELRNDLQINPQKYTPWLPGVLEVMNKNWDKVTDIVTEVIIDD